MPTTMPPTVAPHELLAAWPDDWPVAALHAGRPHEAWARWSVFGLPRAVVVHDTTTRRETNRHAPEPSEEAWARLREIDFTHDPLADLAAVLNSLGPMADANEIATDGPATPMLIGALGYELGDAFEPRAAAGRQSPPRKPESPSVAPSLRRFVGSSTPTFVLAFCPHACAFDHVERRWHVLGDADDAAWRDFEAQLRANLACPRPRRHYELTGLRPEQPREAVEAVIARAIEYVHAGDAFQINLTQRFRARFAGSRRALFEAALRLAPSRYAACLEFGDDGAVLSLSPELFLRVDPVSRRVVTRPIKGTRPSGVDPRELLESDKDAAELAMIVDLMRNDLGRVAAFGSVRVEEARGLETHPTVHQTLATVSARLRDNVGTMELLAATFPPGSVTGAPKIRAMQIIRELEPVERGFYCGAIGRLGPGGAACLNVAIRTLTILGEHAFYSAGGGIVADSRPEDEYEEAMEKTAIVRRLLTDAPGRARIGLASSPVPEPLLKGPP